MKGEYILVAGISLDIITTLIGIFMLGLKEGNPLGLSGVLFINFLVILFCFYTIKKARIKLIDYLFYLVGFSRVIVAFYNFYLFTIII